MVTYAMLNLNVRCSIYNLQSEIGLLEALKCALKDKIYPILV